MKCRYCGCTDAEACAGGCCWVAPRVCSKCADRELQKLGVHAAAGVYVPTDLLKLMMTAMVATFSVLQYPENDSMLEQLGEVAERDMLIALKAYRMCEERKLVPPARELIPASMQDAPTQPTGPRLWRPGDA